MGKTGKKQNRLEIEQIYDIQHFSSEAMYYALLTVPKDLRKKTYELAKRRIESYFEMNHGR